MNDKRILRNLIRQSKIEPKSYAFKDLDGDERLVTLDISGSRLVELQPGIFDGLDQLRELSLEYNDLKIIPHTAFRDLIHLQRLTLARNAIDHIDSEMFDSCNHLEELDISENRISDIAAGSFSKMKSLRILDLHRNLIGNSAALEGEVFAFTQNLEVLNLRNNYIRKVGRDAFLGLKNIIRLDLSNNSLMEIDIESDELSRLEILNVANNQITQLSLDTFQNLTSLKELHLRGNEIQELEVDYLIGKPNLQHVDLRDNPLHEKLRRIWRGNEISQLKELLEIYG